MSEQPAPLDVIAEVIEASGRKRFDPKAFLLGYLIGREWDGGSEAKIREIAEGMYPPRRRRKSRSCEASTQETASTS